jgi:hypothetical protein
VEKRSEIVQFLFEIILKSRHIHVYVSKFVLKHQLVVLAPLSEEKGISGQKIVGSIKGHD